MRAIMMKLTRSAFFVAQWLERVTPPEGEGRGVIPYENNQTPKRLIWAWLEIYFDP